MQLNLIRYYTGVACGNGHISERNTITGNCLPCQGEHQRRRRRNINDNRALEGLGLLSIQVKVWPMQVAMIRKLAAFLVQDRMDAAKIGRPEIQAKSLMDCVDYLEKNK